MAILHRRLRDYLNREIVVVMVDGRAFKGVLTEYDETAMVLKDVLETSTSEVRWKLPFIQAPGFRYDSRSSGDMVFGEREKLAPSEKEVVLILHSIIRIWLWGREKPAAKEAERPGTKKV